MCILSFPNNYIPKGIYGKFPKTALAPFSLFPARGKRALGKTVKWGQVSPPRA